MTKKKVSKKSAAKPAEAQEAAKPSRTTEEVVAAALMHLAQRISGYFGLTGLAKELAKTAEAVHNGKV